MTNQEVVVEKETLSACMTCPLCNKLLKEATTICECLHTFCRKCIYEKLADEEHDCCPICNIDLGCAPVEKLRPDHNLQDIRAKVFPFKRRKVNAPESVPPIPMPTRRKERSLSSLVVSTPRVSTQTSMTRRRTKAVARKAGSLRASNFSTEGPGRKEEVAVDDFPESSSSRETLTKIAQYRRQNSSTANLYLKSNNDTENGAEPKTENLDLWKPLNCLVDAANRTKSSKKSESSHASVNESSGRKTKVREHADKRVHEDKNETYVAELVKPKLQRTRRKRAATSEDLPPSAQTIVDAACFKQNKSSPIWFTLLASDDQEGHAPLPQISTSYLRIKDGSVPVSFIQKYLMNKLDLSSEAEVEIACRGQPVIPSLQLRDLVNFWVQTSPVSQKVQTSVGSSGKDFMMVLTYRRKVQPIEVN